MFTRILLPTDGSRHSREAARIAGEMARRHHGTVHPLVAVEFEHLVGGDLSPEVIDSIRRKIEQRAGQVLAEANEEIRAQGGRTDGGSVEEGPPEEVILRLASEGSFDLVVMGSRGMNLERDGRRHLGSVTERVLHSAPCPVLVIRAEPAP